MDKRYRRAVLRAVRGFSHALLSFYRGAPKQEEGVFKKTNSNFLEPPSSFFWSWERQENSFLGGMWAVTGSSFISVDLKKDQLSDTTPCGDLNFLPWEASCPYSSVAVVYTLFFLKLVDFLRIEKTILRECTAGGPRIEED